RSRPGLSGAKRDSVEAPSRNRSGAARRGGEVGRGARRAQARCGRLSREQGCSHAVAEAWLSRRRPATRALPAGAWRATRRRRARTRSRLSLRQGEAELRALFGGVEADLRDRSDRQDHLARALVLRVRTDGDEAVARIGRERDQLVAGAVPQLEGDDDVLALRRDLAVQLVDEVVVRPLHAWHPELGHALSVDRTS